MSDTISRSEENDGSMEVEYSMPPSRLWSIAVIGAAFLLLTGLPAAGKDNGISQLKEGFNKRGDTLRIVAILSPT
jgi:hypothetical protein